MKRKDIRQMSESEVDKLVHDTIEEIGKLRFQLATGQLENVHLIRTKRKILARALTIHKIKSQASPAKKG